MGTGLLGGYQAMNIICYDTDSPLNRGSARGHAAGVGHGAGRRALLTAGVLFLNCCDHYRPILLRWNSVGTAGGVATQAFVRSVAGSPAGSLLSRTPECAGRVRWPRDLLRMLLAVADAGGGDPAGALREAPLTDR